MNLLQLVTKQMRQRALSTWLTLLSVLLGVALAVAIMVLRREAAGLFGQSDYGFDVLVGARGSPLQLTLNTIYHIDRSPGNIPFSLYEEFARPGHPLVRSAVPIAVGDNYEGYRIIATIPGYFGGDEQGTTTDPNRAFEYRKDRRFELAAGRVFHARKFEAVIGSEISARTGLSIGSTFKAAHGLPGASAQADVHAEQWTVVGILAPTHTANDRLLFIPLTTFYTIEDHEEGLKAIGQLKRAEDPDAHDEHDHDDETDEAMFAEDEDDEHAHHDHEHGSGYTVADDGTIDLKLPRDQWLISAILIEARSPFTTQSLMWEINNKGEALAVNPAMVMREFFTNFLNTSATILLMISLLVTVVAGVSILVSIYNSVSARRREIAILRALGATRQRVLALICLEAGLVGLMGGILGLVAGHALGALASLFTTRVVGEKINWAVVDPWEWLYLGLVVLIAVLAGLVPALKAYRTPVAVNLVAE